MDLGAVTIRWDHVRALEGHATRPGDGSRSEADRCRINTVDDNDEANEEAENESNGCDEGQEALREWHDEFPFWCDVLF